LGRDLVATCCHCHSAISDTAVFCPACGAAVPGATECTDYEYEAFVSYRHLPHDTAVAKQIQRLVEGFKVPKDLACDRAGQKMGRLFRDEDELPTAASLSDQIRHALEHSRFLVVVCTPDTLESRWIEQEVKQFAELHGRDRILVALAQAEPDDSFPPLLLAHKVVAADGTVLEEPVEPLAADFRDKRKYRQEALRLVATMVGCGYDDLRQRQRARRNRTIALVASIVAAVAIAFGAVSVYQQMQIVANYRQMQINQSEFLANEANELLAQGDRYQAMQVALAALPASSESDDRPYVPAAQLALENSLQVFPAAGDWLACYSQTDVDTWNSCASEQLGLVATISEGSYVEIREIESGDLVQRIDVRDFSNVALSRNETVAMAFAGDDLLFMFRQTIGCFDARTGQLHWRHEVKNGAVWEHALAVSPDGAFVAVPSLTLNPSTAKVRVLDVASGDEVESHTWSELPDESSGIVRSCFSPDSSALAAVCDGVLVRMDVRTGETEQKQLDQPKVNVPAYVGDSLAIVSSSRAIGASESVVVSLLDADLETLWQKTLPVDQLLDASFTEYNSIAEVVGAWDYSQGDVPGDGAADYQVVVAAGCNLYLLDAHTGDEVYRKTFKTPLVECAVKTDVEDGSSFIVHVTGEGDVCYAAPTANGDSAYLDIFLERTVGRLYRAECVQYDGRWFLSAWQQDPLKHAVFRYVSTADLSAGERADELLNDASYYWNGQCIVAKTSAALSVFDVATLTPSASIDLASVDQLASPTTARFTHDGSDRVYLAGQASGSGNSAGSGSSSWRCAVVAFDGKTGELAFEYAPADDAVMMVGYLLDRIDAIVDPQSGSHLVLLHDTWSVTLIEAEGSGRVLLNAACEDATATQSYVKDREKAGVSEGELVLLPGKGSVEDAYLAGQNLVVFTRVEVEGSSGAELHVSVIDWKTGDLKLQDTALCSCIGKTSGPHTVSRDGKRLVIACADDVTRAFDVETGALLWKSTDIPSDANCVQVVGNGDVFFQDHSGICALASGATGRKLCVASTRLPALQKRAIYDEKTNTLLAFRTGSVYHNVFGIAFISLDQDAFGPFSYVNNGIVASPASDKVIMEYGYDSEYVVRRLSLDELIALAHGEIEGHELTDTERQLYHIDFE